MGHYKNTAIWIGSDIKKQEKEMLVFRWCGSGLIMMVCGSGSTHFDECGSGSSPNPGNKDHQIDFNPSFKSRNKIFSNL